ncbi:MAG: grasp-with-spasm system ATP-grasp peptide maturase [Bacteroidales bacterium]|jgi:ATP-GRASP peptide maturase of grasp-with-spasm system|nr:grasp-with-spasm system ATP-grasp peptide maturase [Bacteroidales bacterium]
MILILTDTNEPTTDWVIDWLHFFRKDFVRLSIETPIIIKSIYDKKGEYECVFEYLDIYRQWMSIDTANISSYWYRRSDMKTAIKPIRSENENINQMINAHSIDENRSALNILYSILNRKKRINKIEDGQVTKLKVLQCAKDLGIRVPDTLICTDKKTLFPFYEFHNGRVITKSIGDPTVLFFQNIHCFTSEIDIDDIPDMFGLSLFQEKIEKFVELRIFYLHGKFYGSAIFSQLDSQTKMDFKNYNDEKPNRVVPYKLPDIEQHKFRQLMKLNDFNSGSLDIVLTPQYEYVFLEVNPVGQFEQVSVPCNYNLLKTIAEYL